MAGLAKAPWTSTGRIVRVASRTAAPARATTSERSLPQMRATTTEISTVSAIN